jgi:hypothetical protein
MTALQAAACRISPIGALLLIPALATVAPCTTRARQRPELHDIGPRACQLQRLGFPSRPEPERANALFDLAGPGPWSAPAPRQCNLNLKPR